MAEDLIPATVIGSWSFPGWFEKFIADVKAQPDLFGPADRDEAVRDAVRLAIDDQLRAGLDRITDGEMQRVDFNLGFYEYLGGLEPIPRTAAGAPGARSARPLSRDRAAGRARRTGHRGRISPAPRIHAMPRSRCPCRARSPWPAASTAARFTPTATRVTDALIPIVNAELRALVAAGVDFIQLDEPSFACHPERPRVVPRRHRPHGRRRACLYQHAHVLWQLPRPGRRRIVLTSRCFPHLGRARVNQLALEFASREMAEVELLAQLPETMDVAVGLVDVKNTWIEPPELVAERLRTVLKYVDAARVSVTPDCGFSQTARHVAVAKARAMVEGVRLVRKVIKR